MKTLLPACALAVLLLVPPVAAQVKAPTLPDAPPRSAPGLILTMKAGDQVDTRAARLVTLYVPKGEPISPFLPAGAFTAAWQGEIT